MFKILCPLNIVHVHISRFKMDHQQGTRIKDKMDNKQRYSTWNSAQCYMAAWIGGEIKGQWIYVFKWLSPICCPSETTTLLISYTPTKNN